MKIKKIDSPATGTWARDCELISLVNDKRNGFIMQYPEIKKIQTKENFISFLRALKKDYSENLSAWENRDIETFLGAMASWVEDMDGFYINQGLPIPEKLDWKVFADILMGGKLYE